MPEKSYPNVTQKILLRCGDEVAILRHPGGSYDFPGGRLEMFEDLFDSLQRELKEEINYFLNGKPELFHVWSYISKDKTRHSVMIYYIYGLDKKPELVSPEKLEIFWLKKDKMMDIIKDQDFLERIYSWNG